jgi:hypothetical protein
MGRHDRFRRWYWKAYVAFCPDPAALATWYCTISSNGGSADQADHRPSAFFGNFPLAEERQVNFIEYGMQLR